MTHEFWAKVHLGLFIACMLTAIVGAWTHDASITIMMLVIGAFNIVRFDEER